MSKQAKLFIALFATIAIPIWFLGCWTLWRLVILGGLCA